jgi:hypothetical protein
MKAGQSSQPHLNGNPFLRQLIHVSTDNPVPISASHGNLENQNVTMSKILFNGEIWQCP